MGVAAACYYGCYVFTVTIFGDVLFFLTLVPIATIIFYVKKCITKCTFLIQAKIKIKRESAKFAV